MRLTHNRGESTRISKDPIPKHAMRERIMLYVPIVLVAVTVYREPHAIKLPGAARPS
jgi:hypothetical protein